MKAVGVKQKPDKPVWLAVLDDTLRLMRHDEARSFLDEYGVARKTITANHAFSPHQSVACLLFDEKIWVCVNCDDMTRIPVPMGVWTDRGKIEKMPVVIWLVQK